MRSRLALARAADGGQAAWSLIGEAAVGNASSASITTQQLETLPVDRRETEMYVESVMAALEEFSAHAARTAAGASWLHVQHVPVRRLVTQLVRKFLALASWEPFAQSPGPLAPAPYEGLVSIRPTSSREYRAYTVTWSGVAYALGAPTPHSPPFSAGLRRITAELVSEEQAPEPPAAVLPKASVVALSWSSRHWQTLLPVLRELAAEGRKSVLVDLASDPAERCPSTGAEAVLLHSGPAEMLAQTGSVPGLGLGAEDDAGSGDAAETVAVVVGPHRVRLDRLARLAAAVMESSSGCTQPSWRASVHAELWLNDLLGQVGPHTVLVSNDTSPLGVLAVHSAEARGLNTVLVQHGAWTSESVTWPALHSRHIVVMGERDVAPARAGARHPKAEIHVLGQPRFDTLIGVNLKAQRRYMEKLLARAMEPPGQIMVWACQPLSPEQLEAQADLLVTGMAQAIDQWGLVIAPHPAQGSEAFAAILRSNPQVAVADGAVGARGCLAAADALVSVYSTCGIEALLVDVPVLELKLPGQRTLGLAEHGLARPCSAAAEVTQALDQLRTTHLAVTRDSVDAVCRWRGNSALDVAQLIVARGRRALSDSDPRHATAIPQGKEEEVVR
ncbi:MULTISPECIES: hypothetical protein [Streptomyces]|uniref:hypothetical protein n=1 Tax=Streptomyces TaxID=1883 RepID=UPI00225849B3|nr:MULTISPECIES: hypothetical protein [Streptomyces]MCX5277766.1 hypothetical protein [Streptomyces virginiae]MCX5583113.1 hypothetical protein [Streptomyces erythrochromogenes]